MIKKNIYSSFIKYLYESNLTQVQYRLALYLLYNSDKSYKFITNNSFLIDTLGATKKTIIEAIKELLKKNIITKNNLQNGYELAVVFEQKKEVKEAPAEPTPAEVSSDTTEVAPEEKPKRSRKSKQPAEPTPIPIKEVISKLEEKAPAEGTPDTTEVAPEEKSKRSRKAKQHKEPTPAMVETPTSAEPTPAPAEEAPTEKPKRSRKPKKEKITKEE